ncbi:MAG: hypothetical protein A2082_06725 [Chloroflexi bacterium GWC2_70_10]|nr:MAG: hypothetical protein A2082_06725 [Chloroflexi bacterium GWC2_70_10]
MRKGPADLGEAIELVKQLPAYARLAWDLLRDPRVPAEQKLILAAVGAYVLMPLDIIPDFIPVLGQVDDVAVVLLGLRWFIRAAPEEVVSEHLARIGRNDDDMRRDLEQAQRLLGESFAKVRQEFDRMLARKRGSERDEQGGTTNERP